MSAPRPFTTKRPADFVPLRVGPHLQLQHLVDPRVLLLREAIECLRVGGQEGVAVGLELAHVLLAVIQSHKLRFGDTAGLLQLRKLGG